MLKAERALATHERAFSLRLGYFSTLCYLFAQNNVGIFFMIFFFQKLQLQINYTAFPQETQAKTPLALLPSQIPRNQTPASAGPPGGR